MVRQLSVRARVLYDDDGNLHCDVNLQTRLNPLPLHGSQMKVYGCPLYDEGRCSAGTVCGVDKNDPEISIRSKETRI